MDETNTVDLLHTFTDECKRYGINPLEYSCFEEMWFAVLLRFPEYKVAEAIQQLEQVKSDSQAVSIFVSETLTVLYERQATFNSVIAN